MASDDEQALIEGWTRRDSTGTSELARRVHALRSDEPWESLDGGKQLELVREMRRLLAGEQGGSTIRSMADTPTDPDSGDDDIPELPDDDADHKAWTDDPLHRDIEEMDDDEVDADDQDVTEEDDDDAE